MQAQVDGFQAFHSDAVLKHLWFVRPALLFGQVGQLQGPVFEDVNVVVIFVIFLLFFASELYEDRSAVSPLDELAGYHLVLQLQDDAAADGSVNVAFARWRARWRQAHVRDDANI